MEFKTTLFKIFDEANYDHLTVNGNEIDDFETGSAYGRSNDQVALTQFEVPGVNSRSRWWFRDQEVTVDDDGVCQAVEADSRNVCSLGFKVLKPLTLEDLG